MARGVGADPGVGTGAGLGALVRRVGGIGDIREGNIADAVDMALDAGEVLQGCGIGGGF